MPSDSCQQNTDPLKLVRHGSTQADRLSAALKPEYAPVNEREIAHGMVFGQVYSTFLQYYNSSNKVAGDWSPFFSQDVSVQLAIASVENIENYKTRLNVSLDFLNDLDNKTKDSELKKNLGLVFSLIGTLAKNFDDLKGGLPDEIPLKKELQNLIRNQLAPGFQRLISYYAADVAAAAPHPLVGKDRPDISIFGKAAVPFLEVYDGGLSNDWITVAGVDWNTYKTSIAADSSVFGSGATVFDRANHIATHNLFTSILDQFLKVFARVVSGGKAALQMTLTKWDRHQPHYGLFLAFLRLFEYARAETNTLTQRHLDFYYRQILQLKEKPSSPGHVHLLVELAKQVPGYLLAAGELFKAGKDKLGKEAFYRNDKDFVANQAKVAALKTVYRHTAEPVGLVLPTTLHEGRLFASPIANSENGLGEALISEDQSWHPFHNKRYQDAALAEIKMPLAEVGFAIASPYLWMAEGSRRITIDFTLIGTPPTFPANFKDEILCFLTTEEGYVQKVPTIFDMVSGALRLQVQLTGADPAITPYQAKTHGYHFATEAPILLVKLRQQTNSKFGFSLLEDIKIGEIKVIVEVSGLKSVSISNDFGPVDRSKPFQPFGPSPIAGNSLIIGSKEVFQKKLVVLSLNLNWLTTPNPYPITPLATATVDYLIEGKWVDSTITASSIGTASISFVGKLDALPVANSNFAPDEPFDTSSREGYVRLKLASGYGQVAYQAALIKYLTTKVATDNPGDAPVGPTLANLSLDYSAIETIFLNTSDLTAFNKRASQFFHIGPFGYAEKHPFFNPALPIYLMPQFKQELTGTKNESEFYIGITGLKPPQNLSLLIQVVDGTADPLTEKPVDHIHWSYLRSDEWTPFAKTEVNDQTSGFINSGLVSFSIPREATSSNTLLPVGYIWLRASVTEKSDAVCQLRLVAAQGLAATFEKEGIDPDFSAAELPPGTITKLNSPVAEIKAITQPFSTFGTRGAEVSTAFYTRVSERLRHKDRAITLWDYERLILEAFPEIFQVKCLNHTFYEPNPSGTGIYRELAPGHVTVVTIPDLQKQKLRNPLRPYTSLGVLNKIENFLRKRFSCFVQLHVKNPQFEEVRVRFKVRFTSGSDETFFANQLREEITRFLSPWAFSSSAVPSFGGKVYKSVLINFIEERPFVDYVTDFELFLDLNGVPGIVDSVEVEGSKAVSILVSAPAKKHEITVLNPADDLLAGETCLCEA